MKKPGRNDPCSCGSGRKYKHCCGRIQLTGIEPVGASTPMTIDAALEHHQAGRLLQAEAIYRQILQVVPNHPEALHFLGLIAHQAGRNGAAIELISRAITVNPYDAMHCNLGLALKAQGRLDEAIASYREALSIKPDHFEALNNLGVVFHEQGRFDEAVLSYRQALSIKPDYVEAIDNLGLALRAQGEINGAIDCHRKAVSIRPDFAGALYNLGTALQAQCRFDEAVASYRQALSIKPDYVDALNNLGVVLHEQGRFDEAVASYRQALSIKPNYFEALNNLGGVLQEQRKFDDALYCFRKALEAVPGLAITHTNIALVLDKQNKLADALIHCRKALDIAPDQVAANVELNKMLNNLVSQWHVPMMNDKMRNEAYFAALRTAIRPNSSVLEIGTGSGLLAMMAAQCGANQVTTCEAEPVIATTARQIIADNHLDEKIKVIGKRSSEVTVGDDLHTPADLLLTEIFSNELLAENALASIEDAKRRLLKPGARVIPASGSIMIALFGGDDIGRNLVVSKCCGFDVKRFNSITPRKQVVMRNDLNIELLADDVEAFYFDFEKDSHFPEENKVLSVPIRASGLCYGIIQWIRLRMDREIVFENHPSVKSPASGWQHCVYVFPEPVAVTRNQVALIVAAHNRVHPWFFLEELKETIRPA
jgi:protein arginine N-methyltransferase 7